MCNADNYTPVAMVILEAAMDIIKIPNYKITLPKLDNVNQLKN